MGRTGRGRLAPALAGLAIVAAGLVATPAPAGAGPEDSDALVFVSSASGQTGIARNDTVGVGIGQPVASRPFAGAFTYFGGQSVFLYTPGPTPDGILAIEADGTGEGFGTQFVPKTVNGTYQPVVGDFDGNGYDDVLWYAPGPAADSLWLFSGNGAHSVRSRTINGSYRPAVIDANGDGHDDIVWYAPGTKPDSLWLSGIQGTYTTRPLTITNDFQLVVGRFGDCPRAARRRSSCSGSRAGTSGSGPSTTTPATRRAPPPPTASRWSSTPEGGRARLGVLVQPGGVRPRGVHLTLGGGALFSNGPDVNGTYDPVVGDYDGDGGNDIAWTRPGTATIWLLDPGGETRDEVRVDLGITDSQAFAAEVLAPA